MYHIIADLQTLRDYAFACLEFKNYLECAEICDVILQTEENDTNSDIMMKAMIAKGQARFYSYKRKLQQIVIDSNVRQSKEGRLILKECFESMKEAIDLLGKGLDLNMLDEEGSKLLDWAMIDCVSLNNQLDQCKRCLLCRHKKEALSKSHVWPKFIMKSLGEEQSSYLFGLDIYQLKSASACIYRMLCGRCESLLSQNGENDFSTKFPMCGEIANSPWLFNFCVGLIFRTLSISVQFPMHFNDDEVYEHLLLCRKHLLSLPVSHGDQFDYERKELTELNGNIDMYLFMSPQKSKQNYGFMQVPYPDSSIALSRDKQLDSKSLKFNGYVHFYMVCCGPITLIIPFNDQSVFPLKNKGFHLASNELNSDRRYTIPSEEEERVKLLPAGAWLIVEQLTEGFFKNASQLARFISEEAKLPGSQAAESLPSVSIPPVAGLGSMFQLSYLPREYEIINPHLKLPRNQCVKLPKGHQVIVHACRTIQVLNAAITFLLCIKAPESSSASNSFYVIFISQSFSNHAQYSDGAYVDIKDDKLVLTKFLVQNKLTNQLRRNLDYLQRLLNITLPNKHFDNIDLMMYLINCRRYYYIISYSTTLDQGLIPCERVIQETAVTPVHCVCVCIWRVSYVWATNIVLCF